MTDREKSAPKKSPIEEEEGNRPVDELEYFISLDLGSESIAACFQHEAAPQPLPINLQEKERAYKIQQWQKDQDPIDFLPEHVGAKFVPSHRLRNRISLRPGQQPSPLPAEHAQIDLTKSNAGSIFQFFQREGQTLASESLLPNPKLLFQSGIREVIPSVKGPDGNEVEYDPEELLGHLTVQILNNLVLNSSDLEWDSRRRKRAPFDPRMAHLTITVPNVYSITHVKELRDFVRHHVEVGAVSTMYESDAIAHFMIGDAFPDDPKDVQDMKQRISKALESKGRDASNCRILTIDIGKGTTDLSLFNYDFNHKAKSFTYDVLARTGRSHGGARLSYILAEHLEEQIQPVFEQVAADDKVPEPVRKAIKEKRPRLSVLTQPAGAPLRGAILGAAEQLIETYKQNLDEHYNLVAETDLSPSARKLVQELCKEIISSEAINLTFEQSKGGDEGQASAAQPTEADVIRRQISILQERLMEALSFPRELPADPENRKDPPGDKERWSFFRRSAQAPAPAANVPDTPFVRLRRKLEEYVQQNVEEPLEWLLEMAQQHERTEKRLHSRRVEGEQTFAIVAGQASRFKPIQKAISEALTQRIGLSGSQILFLRDQLAKMVCCYGVQSYYSAALRCNNPDRIMGTYGFLRKTAPRDLRVLDMQTLNQPMEAQDVDLMNGHYWLVFQPRALSERVIPLDQQDRDSMARVRIFKLNRGGRVSIRYLGKGEGIEVAEGEGPFVLVKYESTYGNVGGDIDEIYRKSWPEAVPHEKGK